MEQVKIDRLVYKRTMGKLHVRVSTTTTGKPLRARVHLNAADGRAYAPTESWFRADWMMFDHMDQAGEYHYFHTAGEFRGGPAAGKHERSPFPRDSNTCREEERSHGRGRKAASLTVQLQAAGQPAGAADGGTATTTST